MRTRRRAVPAVVPLLALCALVACGGGGGASSPPTPVASPTPDPNATFTPLPAPQGSPLGIAAFTVSGGEQAVLPVGAAGSPYVPDEQLSYLRQPNGTFNLWAAAGGTYGAYLFRTSDLGALGTPTTVFTPSGPGTTAFDADYAGPGSVFPAANGTDLLMIYHAENHLFGGVDYPGSPFYAGIGLARSHDGGVTWTRQGEIISAHDPQQATQAATGLGALTPSAILSGGYIYVCFRESDMQSNTSGYALARAPIATDGAPGSWQKYAQGAFSTPGLGGAFTPLAITLDPTTPGDERQPSISFNTAVNAFVMVTVGNGGVYVLTSPNLVTWSTAVLALPAPTPDAAAGASNGPRNWYPTLITPSRSSSELTGATGYLYYAKFFGDGTSHHAMYRQAFTLSPGVATSSSRR